ncbi:MAG: hypothetical protein LBR70_06775 [Lactobacillaceae bacterium]|nr:hypothetical protein [Lactobacillaceae bacterium]
MKKFLHALPGNLDIAKGKTAKATILGREKDSILVQLENGMFATIDFDNVFMKCGPHVWARMIAAKSKYEQTKVRITHITCDEQIRVVPWGKYEKYAKRAKDISDTIRAIDDLKQSVAETYVSLKECERLRPDIVLHYIDGELAKEKDETAQKLLIKQRERVLDTLGLIRDKEAFIIEATREILDGEELLREFNLL